MTSKDVESVYQAIEEFAVEKLGMTKQTVSDAPVQ